MNPSNQEIAIHDVADDQHQIVVFKPTDDGYVRDRSAVIDVGTSEKIKCFVAYANNTIVAVAGNGPAPTASGLQWYTAINIFG